MTQPSMHLFFVRLRGFAGVLLSFGIVVGVTLFSPATALAAGCTFASTEATNDFNLDANWSCGHVPAGADGFTIPAATTTNMTGTASAGAGSVLGTLNIGAQSLTATSLNVDGAGVATSTSGSLTISGSGAVTNSGAIGTNSGTFSFTGTFLNNAAATFDVGAGTATTTGLFTNTDTGIVNGGSGTLAFLADFLNNGTFNSQTGTVRVAGTAAQSISGGLFYSLSSLKTAETATIVASSTVRGNLNANGSGGTISSVTSSLSILGTATTLSGAVVTSTSGVLTFFGAVTNAGSLGSSSGDILFSTTLQNNGTFDVSSGAVTSTGTLTNGAAGTINGNGGTLNFVADFTNSGTFNKLNGTVRVYGTATQSIGGALYNNFTSLKTSGTATFTASSTVTGNLDLLTSGGTLSGGSVDFTSVSTTILSGATVTSTSGVLTFTAAVTSTGSIGSSSGNILFGSTLQNNGTLNISSGTVTSTGVLTNSGTGTINGNGGTLALKAGWTNTGTFNAKAGTVRFAGTAAQTIPATTFYNVVIRTTGGNATITATTTANGTTQIASGSTFAIGTIDYVGVGTFTNLGTITRGIGRLIHTAESIKLTDGAGTEVSSYATAGSPAMVVYVTIQDSNRNLLGGTIETMSVPVTLDATAGSDSETLTLTETTASSGIFRNATALSIVPATSVSTPGDGEFQLVASGVGTATYADDQDSADTGTDTITFTKTAASTSSGTTTGGGGGGSTIPGSSGISASGYAAPASNPAPITVTAAPEGQQSLTVTSADYIDPSDFSLLLSTYGFTASPSLQSVCLLQVRSDAKAFGLTLTSAQEVAMCNFIVYGNSTASIKFGSGERRAILRDYLDTMRRANVVWSDIERMATGKIMISRNLPEEQKRVNTILPVFQMIFGHVPNFKDAKENLAWNTMQYRLRFPRNLTLEANGLKIYRATFHRDPTTPFGWSVVRVLGYVK